MRARKIYLASSWRNKYYPQLLLGLRQEGHEVYDFRDPQFRFKWGDIDPDWQSHGPESMVPLLKHSEAARGFQRDADALVWSDTVVLLQPCGASAHLELGWGIASHKDCFIYLKPDRFEPELMYRYVPPRRFALSDEELYMKLRD